MTSEAVNSVARVITSNVILNLMNDLPGFRELVDKASRKKGYSWSAEVDRFEADVREILFGRLDGMIQD